jgi:hypothetical protein
MNNNEEQVSNDTVRVNETAQVNETALVNKEKADSITTMPGSVTAEQADTLGKP